MGGNSISLLSSCRKYRRISPLSTIFLTRLRKR